VNTLLTSHLQLDSAFQLQEHLAALHHHHTQGNTVPLTRETAKLLATPPASIDRTLWLYELCRFLIAQCNSLIVGFLFDSPPCSAATCPEMRASEWQFLCAVHDSPKSCCAIDYCCHTLDWAANVVTNPKIFPSRFVAPLASDGHDKNTSLKNLVNIFRRLHRIFAHAWFQHRGVFWSVEGQTGLYVFFKTVCDLYDLLPAENYKLPPEAEGLETAPMGAADGGDKKNHAPATTVSHPVITAIARPLSAVQRTPASATADPLSLGDDDGFNNAAARTNTRRHIRSNPSTGNAISMVPEVDEDADSHAGGLAGRMKEMSISSSRPPPPAVPTIEEPQPEAEVADVPVIVLEDVNDAPAVRREREIKVETRETGEEQPEPVEIEEEKPSEAEPEIIVVENELEKSVPAAAVDRDEEPATEDTEATASTETAKEEEEGEQEEVGDETVVPSEDEDALPSESGAQPEEEEPPLSAIQSEDFSEAVAREDPAAAAVVAGGEKEGDALEEKNSEDKEEGGDEDGDDRTEEKLEGEEPAEKKED
jgi:hypothetical protein